MSCLFNVIPNSPICAVWVVKVTVLIAEKEGVGMRWSFNYSFVFFFNSISEVLGK